MTNNIYTDLTPKEFLLRTIADRIKNNVELIEFNDGRDTELDVTECMKLIINDFESYEIRRKLNMKKKYRDISVNNKIYAWQVKVDEDGKRLFIWYNKKIISKSDILGSTVVTPKYVADLIKKINDFDKISPVSQNTQNNISSDNLNNNDNDDFMMKI